MYPTYRPHNFIKYNDAKILGIEHFKVKCHVITLIINLLTKIVTHGIDLMIGKVHLQVAIYHGGSHG